MSELLSGPALGILELEHIARGVLCADAMFKRTEIAMLSSRPISGGKHLIYLRGPVGEMEEAMDAGRSVAGDSLVDSLFLPFAHKALWPVLPDARDARGWSTDVIVSAAIVETSTICALMRAMDAVCKVADIQVRDVRLGMGIMGKAFFTMTGDLPAIEAAADAAREEAQGKLLALEVIPAPATEILGQLIF